MSTPLIEVWWNKITERGTSGETGHTIGRGMFKTEGWREVPAKGLTKTIYIGMY